MACEEFVVDANSKIYFYTDEAIESTTVDIIDDSSSGSGVYLELDDGSQLLCKCIDGNEQENPVKTKDDALTRPKIVEDVADEIDNEKLKFDEDEKETFVLVDASSNFRNELVCFTENGKRSYICQIEGCERRFTSRFYLKTHQRNHTGERPFICNDCNTAFNTDYALKVHSRRHTGEKPYQ